MSTQGPHCIEVDLTVVHDGVPRTMHCDVESPEGSTQGTLLIAHGFMGYKDYGMFPYLASRAAGCGWSAVRFNFCHSGMTRSIETFERTDLFQLDSWNKQVVDLEHLVGVIRAGELPNTDPTKPIVLLGHSRGGMASILFGGRGGDVERVVSVAAGAAAYPRAMVDDAARAQLKAQGTLPVTSSRTGQELHIGRDFLESIEADPAGHDLIAMAGRLGQRLCVIHGTADSTVDLADAYQLAGAAGVSPHAISDGDHVFNVRNPFPRDGEPSEQLAILGDLMTETLRSCAPREVT